MITRNTILGGPCYGVYNSKNIQFVGDVQANVAPVWDDLESALYGKIDKIYKDLVVKVTGTPRYYDTAQIADMWPYTSVLTGKVFPGSSDKTLLLASNNGDTFTLTSALVGKMPDFKLGVGAPVLGQMEYWGVIANSSDASAASSYFATQTGQSFANPAVPGTAVIANQEFTAVWGSISGFTSFQAQDGWDISHELELAPVVIQGRTRAFRVASYRAMAKCKPIGPTVAQIEAASYNQGSGAGGGYQNSANAANLVLTGSNSMTVTVGNAGIVSEGYVFGSKPLRQGEVGWISNLLVSAGGTPTAALTLA